MTVDSYVGKQMDGKLKAMQIPLKGGRLQAQIRSDDAEHDAGADKATLKEAFNLHGSLKHSYLITGSFPTLAFVFKGFRH